MICMVGTVEKESTNTVSLVVYCSFLRFSCLKGLVFADGSMGFITIKPTFGIICSRVPSIEHANSNL